jgi:hypothetical protein
VLQVELRADVGHQGFHGGEAARHALQDLDQMGDVVGFGERRGRQRRGLVVPFVRRVQAQVGEADGAVGRSARSGGALATISNSRRIGESRLRSISMTGTGWFTQIVCHKDRTYRVSATPDPNDLDIGHSIRYAE